MAQTEQPNVVEVRDGRLIVDVAIGKGTPSVSGKNQVYFTTYGNPTSNAGYKIGINLFRKH